MNSRVRLAGFLARSGYRYSLLWVAFDVFDAEIMFSCIGRLAGDS